MPTVIGPKPHWYDLKLGRICVNMGPKTYNVCFKWQSILGSILSKMIVKTISSNIRDRRNCFEVSFLDKINSQKRESTEDTRK